MLRYVIIGIKPLLRRPDGPGLRRGQGFQQRPRSRAWFLNQKYMCMPICLCNCKYYLVRPSAPLPKGYCLKYQCHITLTVVQIVNLFLQWSDYIRDLPTMLRHCMQEFFSVGGLVWMYRLRIIVLFFIALLYFISPLDIIPEAVFGFLGLIDDLFILLLLAIYFSIIYRRVVTDRAMQAEMASWSTGISVQLETCAMCTGMLFSNFLLYLNLCTTVLANRIFVGIMTWYMSLLFVLSSYREGLVPVNNLKCLEDHLNELGQSEQPNIFSVLNIINY